jgi:hypothetical protein
MQTPPRGTLTSGLRRHCLHTHPRCAAPTARADYQVWVVVLANLVAILLQTLAARLGLVTGKHLAQVRAGRSAGARWVAQQT